MTAKTTSTTRARRRSSAEVRRELLSAGRFLFAKRGYEATTQRAYVGWYGRALVSQRLRFIESRSRRAGA